MQVIFGVTLMSVVAVSSVAPAFPRVQEYFQVSAQSVALLISVFTLPGIILAPVIGIMADRLGRKIALVPFLLVFGLAAAGCGFTRDFNLLLLFRFIQGIGAAGLASLNVTLIGDIFDGHRRTEAMGVNASVMGVGTAVYPILGGLLALIGWNYPFFIAALAVPIGLFALFRLENPELEMRGTLRDYFGGALPYMKNKDLMGLFATGILTYFMQYGAFVTYVAFFINERFAASAFVIGLIISSASVVTVLVSAQVGRITKRFGERTLTNLSFVFFALGLLLIPLMPSLPLLVFPSAIFGLGLAINIPSRTSLIAKLVPFEYRGAFMSVNSLVLKVGETAGPALLGIVLAIWGISAVFWFTAVLAIVTAGIGFLFTRRSGTVALSRAEAFPGRAGSPDEIHWDR